MAHGEYKLGKKGYMRLWREKNKDKILLTQREWSKNNRDKTNAWTKAWAEKNPEATRGYANKWARENQDKSNAQTRLYRARKLHRTPSWANLKKIERIYQLASWASKFTDEPLEVDHIIPLQGETISGLHIETNLQIITRTENRSKGNKFPYGKGRNASGIKG